MISLKTTQVPLLLLALLSVGACSGGGGGGDSSPDTTSPADQDSDQNAATNECVIGQSALDGCTLK